MAVLKKQTIKIVCDSCKGDITNWIPDVKVAQLRLDKNLHKEKGKDLCGNCSSKNNDSTACTWTLKTRFAKDAGYNSIADAISHLGKLNFEAQYKKWVLN